jgi:hypothetical protein
VNTDGAGAELDPVEHHVVGERARRARVALEDGHVLFVRRGERVMGGVPTVLGFVPLEHGEVGDPEETEVAPGPVQAKLERRFSFRLPRILQTVRPLACCFFPSTHHEPLATGSCHTHT